MKIPPGLKTLFFFLITPMIYQCGDTGSRVMSGGNDDPQISFATEVQSIFDTHCFFCHGPDNFNGNLLLDSYDHVMAGTSDHGPVVIPGNSAGSLLAKKIQGIAPVGEPLMPFGGPALPPDDIQTILQWIDEGALNTP